MGLEPTTFGITIRRSNQLSYIYQVCFGGAKIEKEAGLSKKSSWQEFLFEQEPHAECNRSISLASLND
jgi:hypothetical protein